MPAVDGSARTFSCVAEIPSTGVIVGGGVGGSGVSDGGGVSVGGSVPVMIKGVNVSGALFIS